MASAVMNRRNFLKVTTGASGGLLLSLSLPGCASLDTGYQETTGEWRPDAWLELTRDDRIVFTLARVEMGQGTYTGLTTLVAEELDVPPERIEVVFAPVDAAYRNPLFGLQLTGGSTSVASSWEPLRTAGASARLLLVQAAARVWQVEAGSCSTRDGVVVHPNGSDLLRYGELVPLADQESLPAEVPLKPRSEWRYLGRDRGRLDAHAKVTGQAEYGIDVDLPGMLYAVMGRSPRYGGRAESFNRETLIAMPGVVDAFITERGVAIVADRYWRARKAQQAIEVSWDNSEAIAVSGDDVFASYRQAADDDPGETERQDGDVEALPEGEGWLTAEYEQPYLAHATMEPMNATAWYRDGKMDVWAPTQAPDLGRIAAARQSDLSPGDINLHTTFLGGGFGRRLTQDYIEEVAAIAVRLSKPVKLIWSREDDMRHGFLRPAMLHRMAARLDGAALTGWDHQIVGPQILDWYVRNAAPAQYPWAPKFLCDTLGKMGLAAEGIATPKDISAIEGAVGYPYQVPNVRVRHTHTDPGVPITWWRSVGYSHNGFAVETFMDELAHQVGDDPYAFRLKLLAQEPRHRQVLERAARLAGWGEPLPEGRARGMALFKSFGTYVAQVVEASITYGEIIVHRVVCSVDCGQVVNPRIVEDQIAGGILFGLTAALYGEITLQDGEIQQSNFHDYRLLTMHQAPVINVDIVDSAESPTGVGEPGVPPVIPALGNALFALTGNRQRRLPFRA
ncbi:MAG: isoquinoline 1-oxidoreductase [Marinobacter sp. 34-60-7]|nr:MAG: isoquinoline 1-oxidoreductase [Marinobacter sp. 34-60-7]